MNEQTWKVGRLANQTGVSIRTLHYYDEINLMTPSHRTGSGHRLYVRQDVERLLRIKLLQQLGFSLDDIRELLDNPTFAPKRVLEMHLRQLRDELDAKRKLCTLLEAITRRMDAKQEIPVEEFLQIIKEIEMQEKIKEYYTEEQLETLRKRGEELGSEHIENVQKEWPELMNRINTAMKNGVDPTSPEVREMVARHQELIQQFTGGDKGIEESLKNMYRNMGQQVTQTHNFNMNPDMADYMNRAGTAG